MVIGRPLLTPWAQRGSIFPKVQTLTGYYYYYVFILGAISPYTTGLKALFNQSDCTGTAPTHK